jgi:oligopeptidase B
LPGEVERVGSIVWAADNRRSSTPLKTRSRSGSISFGGMNWGHRAFSDDVLVFQETTSASTWRRAHARRQVPGDGGGSHTTTESRFLAADDPAGAWTLVAEREDEHEYSIDHRNGLWFIRTNDHGRQLPPGDCAGGDAGARALDRAARASRDMMLEDIDLFERFFVPASAKMGCRGCAVELYGE